MVVITHPIRPTASPHAVNIGTLLTRSVTGRISTEVDPRLAYDAKALAERARALVRLYRQAGVAPDRLLLRVPATWQGIQAIKALEVSGIERPNPRAHGHDPRRSYSFCCVQSVEIHLTP